MLPDIPHTLPAEVNAVMLKVNIVNTKDSVQKRMAPELSILSTEAPTIEQFCLELKKRYADMPESLRIRAWQAEGMTIIHDNVEWLSAQLAVGMYEWMDGSLKVLVEI